MQIKMSTSFFTRPASFPMRMAAGKAMICVRSSASRSWVVSKPSAVPKEVAMSMMVYTPSMYKKKAMR